MDANEPRKETPSKELYAGWHLTYDAIVEPERSAELVDLELLRTALLDLVGLLKMQALIGPVLRDVPVDAEKEGDPDGEVTGVVVFTTGYIAVHTWGVRSRFSLDVFSSNEFDEDVVQEFLKERFNVKTRASRWMVRNWA